MAHRAASIFVLCLLAGATLSHGSRPITPKASSADSSQPAFSASALRRMAIAAWNAGAKGVILPTDSEPESAQASEGEAGNAPHPADEPASSIVDAPEVAPFEDDVDPSAADVDATVSLPGSDNLIISRIHVKPAKPAEPAGENDDYDDDVFSRLLANEASEYTQDVAEAANEEETNVMSVSLPGSDNVIAAVQKPRRDVSNKASSLKEDFAEYDADSVTSVSLPGSDNVIAAVRKPQRHVAATEPTSSFSVSLPGSDNEIVAFGVPARPVSSVVVVDASDEEAAEGEATPSRKSHSWKLFHSAAVTAASSASSASSVHPASDDTDSTFHVSLPGSDNEIWAAHVPHRESNVVVVTDESDRDATTTAIATTITTAATTSTAATSTTPDDDTASVSLPGSDNVIEAFHIRGNKKKTTSFQVSLPGSDNVITSYGVPERKGMTVVATEGAEIAETAVAELAAVSEIAGAQATTEDVFTVSLPGSDNVIAALHVPHKRKFVVAQA